MIAFRLSRPKAVQDEPEAPAPELDVRDCLPGHLHTFQLTSVLYGEMKKNLVMSARKELVRADAQSH